MEIKPASQLAKEKDRFQPTHPYKKLIAEIKKEGEYYTNQEMCEFFNISQPTLTKMCKGLQAPSNYRMWGRRYIWLYTRQDVEEIASAMGIKLRKNWKL
jgi:Mn-dependent DtxR family transcriptional regulator